jgi:hypothetical protein
MLTLVGLTRYLSSPAWIRENFQKNRVLNLLHDPFSDKDPAPAHQIDRGPDEVSQSSIVCLIIII